MLQQVFFLSPRDCFFFFEMAHSIAGSVHQMIIRARNDPYTTERGMSSHLSPSVGRTWVLDRITSGSRTESHLGPGPNHIWVRDQCSKHRGSRTRSHLGPGPNHIWVQDRITPGSRTESHLGPGPNHTWVRDQCSKHRL